MAHTLFSGSNAKTNRRSWSHIPVKTLPAHVRAAYLVAVLLLFGTVAGLSVVLIAFGLIAPYGDYIAGPEIVRTKHVPIGIVLGAGVAPDGKPYKELQARLDVAADALKTGVIQKIIVSGDNRFSHYDEPTAMKRYLVDVRNIDDALVQPDFAGRSTYESCERARKVFQLERTVLISAHSHLARAIFLCRQFGIESYGLATDVEANNSWRRELLARVKAVYNVYLVGEPTVLGDPIAL